MVKKLLQQRRHTGAIRPQHYRAGRKPKILEKHRQRFPRLLARRPDLTLKQLRQALGLTCSLPAIHYALAGLNLTYKRKTLRANEQDRPDVAAGRSSWQQEFVKADTRSLVFLDESGAQTNMTRLRGRAVRGQRVHDHAPAGHWCATTLLGSLRLDGTTSCMTIEAATDTEVFRAYVEHVLQPTLQPGDVVILDNLSPHKNPATLALLAEASVHVRFLPSYSPDLNPIEKMWSKIKEALRAAKARSKRQLGREIARALRFVTATDAAGWFTPCGYTLI